MGLSFPRARNGGADDVAGMLLAIPMMVVLKAVATASRNLQPIGNMLGE